MTITCVSRKPKELLGYSHKKYAGITKQIAHIIYYLYKDDKDITVITDGSQGIAQLMFWAVEYLKKAKPDLCIKNVLYLPYKDFGSKWSAKGPFSRSELIKMFGRADEIRFCNYCTSADITIDNYAAIMQKQESDIFDISDKVFVFTDDTNNFPPHNEYGNKINKIKKYYCDLVAIMYTVENGTMKLTKYKELDYQAS